MAKIKEVLAKNLERILEQKRISQVDLAKNLEVSFKTINGYVKGRTGVSTELIGKLAAALGVEETDLVKPPGPSLDEYKHFFDITAENDRLKKEITELKQQTQASDPVDREIVSILSTFDKSQRERALFYIQGIKDRSSQQSILGKEKKIK